MSDEDADRPVVAAGSDGSPPWKLLALILVLAGLATFFAQNRTDAPIHFLWLDGAWPIWGVIGVSVLIGIVLDRLVLWQWRRARRRKDATAK